jgi:hypothetical protein
MRAVVIAIFAIVVMVGLSMQGNAQFIDIDPNYYPPRHYHYHPQPQHHSSRRFESNAPGETPPSSAPPASATMPFEPKR